MGVTEYDHFRTFARDELLKLVAGRMRLDNVMHQELPAGQFDNARLMVMPGAVIGIAAHGRDRGNDHV